MTGPTSRHWLTGFVFAALAHLILAAFLMGFWRENPQETRSAELPGLEVSLFPGFHQAAESIATDIPAVTAHNPLPPDLAIEPAPAIPLLAAEHPRDPVLPVAGDRVSVSESPPAVVTEAALYPPAPDVAIVPATVLVAEALDADRVSEVSAPIAPAAPVAPDMIQDFVEVPAARIERAAEPVRTLEPLPPLPADATFEPVMLAEPEAPTGMLPTEPLPAVASTPEAALPVLPTEIVSVTAVPPVFTAPDIPAAAVVAAPTAAPTFVTPDPVATVTAAPAPIPLESVIATLVSEPVPLAATPAAEITEVAQVTSVDTPTEAVSAESIPAESTLVGELQPMPVEAIAVAVAETIETIEDVEALALLPETVMVARETPLPPAATGLSDPVREDTDTPEPPSPETARDPPQGPGIQEQYFRVLRDWLDRHKDYPRVSQRRGEEGTVVLAFTLNRYGMVLEHAIVRSSGHSMLDNTVEHLIRRAQPLPAIPPEMNAETLQVIVPIEFRLER